MISPNKCYPIIVTTTLRHPITCVCLEMDTNIREDMSLDHYRRTQGTMVSHEPDVCDAN